MSVMVSQQENQDCIIIDLVIQIIMKRVIKVQWELSTFINYYKVKNVSLERANYRGSFQQIRLTDINRSDS